MRRIDQGMAIAGQSGRRELVGLGMLGSLMQGDRAGACRLWAEHAQALPRTATDDLQLHLLVADCAEE